MITQALQGDTIDMIAHRHFGYSAGITEEILAINPGIARHGEFVPEGMSVKLPIKTAIETPTAKLLQLWD